MSRHIRVSAAPKEIVRAGQDLLRQNLPTIRDLSISFAGHALRLRIVYPPNAAGSRPVVMYFHGGGWVMGDAETHDRLIRELAAGTGAAVVFVEYGRAPEHRYPVAIEQAYAATAALSSWAAGFPEFCAERIKVAAIKNATRIGHLFTHRALLGPLKN